MSSLDIVFSVVLLLSGFLTPVGTRVWSLGNETTCDVLGFGDTVGDFASKLYYASIAIYYFVSIRFGTTGNKVSNRMEPFLHLVCCSYPLAMALCVSHFQLNAHICGVLPCRDDEADEACESTRMVVYNFVQEIEFCSCSMTVSCCMLLIYCHVRTTIRIHERNSTARKIRKQKSDEMSSAPVSVVYKNGPSSEQPESQRTTASPLKDVATQAFLYTGSSILVNVPPLLVFVLQSNDHTGVSFIILAAVKVIFFPLSGLFNCLIFLRHPSMYSFDDSHLIQVDGTLGVELVSGNGSQHERCLCNRRQHQWLFFGHGQRSQLMYGYCRREVGTSFPKPSMAK